MRWSAVAGAAAAVVALVSGCTTATDSDAGTERPEAIVSLSPSLTETLWAVGAGDQVIAVDALSDYPAGVPTTDLSGFSPNVEAVLGHNPDLVVASDDIGGLVSGLQAAGVPTLLLPAAKTLDDVYEQVEQVGAATGHADEADELATRMRSEIDAAVAAAPDREQPLRYFHEVDDTLYTITGNTFLGEIYRLFGLESIADGSADTYPQLSPEFVVAANPDLIFLADGEYGVTAATVAARPGWAGMRAVEDGRIHTLDEDLASRWGPRVVDLVHAVAAAVAAQPAPAR
ncbi:ABC transporter substrate-binding protein [Prescottella sp. R16]|uniref:ABC transporter substrate-binding protein n=1 Tax=Prescottella sp. R16 TaxID=3064529 RepID=UPI00351CE656